MLTKIVKITVIVIAFLLAAVYGIFYYFSTPKSATEVLAIFKNTDKKPILTYPSFKGFTYRKLAMQQDTTLPTLVFVHGAIGAATNFSKYMKDQLLLTKANMISYDRVGYNYNDKNTVQENIAFETALLENLIADIPPHKVIIVGYSYGGPIALATKKKYKKIVLLAPAVYSKVEPMPWLVKFYQWKLTRWLVPKIWKEASKEKLSHQQELTKFEKTWYTSPNTIVCIHGTADWVVPFSNAEFLRAQFPKEQLKLISMNEVGHDLVWSQFDFIKKQLLAQLD
ncbi:alpha/beta fold hydrolase [Tenacibaculum maritimum]|uniref:alpha/beta fold hydrolase n=1 Tax=Tenacibaculum maritimum TaxID=107401 RepID=UPI001E2A37AC|nr:alpha/beta fold hydrolase [Tenacibaculum maritimum]MCD9563571.1 alpha/beta hydrolase [Tenacibaculum maritimum]MCD9566736.1 alpha/beta hydrolase [Tenacibaculum maritimum]MCD9579993.1 alpha/beta hydrolase [Tenacibaculum maritimum]MCD9597550.1 alpha/beta hydrolase [Tenacibaculum maritimum]MCD9614638.1 alpha/beta hydrolase [Tenacibaculum maritimum]